MLSSFAKRKRALDSLYRPDTTLNFGEFICMLMKPQGNYLFTALSSNGEEIYVSIPEKFRKAYYFRANSFVICAPLQMPRLKGEIVSLLSDDQILTLVRESKWPAVFNNQPKYKKYRDKNDINYIDPDLLPPSFSESEEEDSYGEVESNTKEKEDVE